MSSLSAAKTILAADSTLTALATGGIYTPDDLGRLGLNRSNSVCAAAFSGATVAPCIVLKTFGMVVDGLGDDVLLIAARRETLQCWFYQDNGYATIETMMARVFVDLQGQRLGGAVCRWNYDDAPRHDMDLDACLRRVDFFVWNLKD